MIREHDVLRILAEVLGVQEREIYPTATFSEMGMDSLLGLRFARKLQDALGMEVEPEWLFDYPTVEQLSRRLNEHLSV
jgi:acyl carrier protein